MVSIELVPEMEPFFMAQQHLGLTDDFVLVLPKMGIFWSVATGWNSSYPCVYIYIIFCYILCYIYIYIFIYYIYLYYIYIYIFILYIYIYIFIYYIYTHPLTPIALFFSHFSTNCGWNSMISHRKMLSTHQVIPTQTPEVLQVLRVKAR